MAYQVGAHAQGWLHGSTALDGCCRRRWSHRLLCAGLRQVWYITSNTCPVAGCGPWHVISSNSCGQL